MEEGQKKIGLFDFLNSISQNKKNLLSPETEKDYSPYMINRFLSAEMDTVLYAVELNRFRNIDKKMHYDFLRHLIPARKRFFKYMKAETLENEELIKKAFGYSTQKAKEAMAILNEQDYEQIRKRLQVGGADQQKKPRTKRTRK